MKLFFLLKPSIKMPSRRAISGPILQRENAKVFGRGIELLKEHGLDGVALSLDSWKNIKKQSLLGELISCIGNDQASHSLLFSMDDVTKEALVTKHRLQVLECLPAERREAACRLIDKIEVTYFWNNVQSIIDLMKPLCEADDNAQCSFATMGTSLYTLVHCYNFYHCKGGSVGDYMLDSLERRWNKFDKPVYILA